MAIFNDPRYRPNGHIDTSDKPKAVAHDKPASASKEHINRFKMAHNIGVAEYMRERAQDYGLDPNVAYTVGLLHDIGYLDGRQDHEIAGASILESMGCNEDIVNAVMLHGGKLRELNKDKVTDLLVMTVEADSSVDVAGYRVGFEKRLADIEARYGREHPAYDTVSDNIAFIKEYQQERGIGKPYNLYHKSNDGKPFRPNRTTVEKD